jgi:hypothetical protein
VQILYPLPVPPNSTPQRSPPRTAVGPTVVRGVSPGSRSSRASRALFVVRVFALKASNPRVA